MLGKGYYISRKIEEYAYIIYNHVRLYSYNDYRTLFETAMVYSPVVKQLGRGVTKKLDHNSIMLYKKACLVLDRCKLCTKVFLLEHTS